VINADDRQGEVVLVVLDLDGDSGILEGGVDGVDGDGVVRVCGVARDVDDNGEVAALLGEEFLVDERGNGLGEVDGVEEDISLGDLLIRALKGLVAIIERTHTTYHHGPWSRSSPNG
jgi:hypothetical protein